MDERSWTAPLAVVEGTGPLGHDVELYTGRIIVEGTILGPYRLINDYLNERDEGFVKVEDATITLLGAAGSMQKIPSPVKVGRHQLHLVAQGQQSPPPLSDYHARIATGPLDRSRTGPLGHSPTGPLGESLVQKLSFPCYALTSAFIIYGNCQMHQGSTLKDLLESDDLFVPVTQATVYLLAASSSSWKRDLVLVCKEQIQVMYLT